MLLNLFHGTVAVHGAQTCMLFTRLLEVLVLFRPKKKVVFICIRYCLFKKSCKNINLTACYVWDAAHEPFFTRLIIEIFNRLFGFTLNTSFFGGVVRKHSFWSETRACMDDLYLWMSIFWICSYSWTLFGSDEVCP